MIFISLFLRNCEIVLMRFKIWNKSFFNIAIMDSLHVGGNFPFIISKDFDKDWIYASCTGFYSNVISTLEWFIIFIFFVNYDILACKSWLIHIPFIRLFILTRRVNSKLTWDTVDNEFNFFYCFIFLVDQKHKVFLISFFHIRFLLFILSQLCWG